MRCVYGSAPERAVEDLRLHGARDDVDGRRDAALAPVRAQALAQHDEAVALVVDAREEALERALQRHRDAGLQELVLRELLGEKDVVRRHEVRRVHAQERDALHLAEPHAELEKQRRRLREEMSKFQRLGSKTHGASGSGRCTPG